MNETRRMTALSLVAVLALLFTFGLGAVTSYVIFQPASAQSARPLPTQPSGGGSAPTATTGQSNGGQSSDIDAQLDDFRQALELLQQEYYGRPLDTQKLVYTATKAAFDSLG